MAILPSSPATYGVNCCTQVHLKISVVVIRSSVGSCLIVLAAKLGRRAYSEFSGNTDDASTSTGVETYRTVELMCGSISCTSIEQTDLLLVRVCAL